MLIPLRRWEAPCPANDTRYESRVDEFWLNEPREINKINMLVL
jgi:hypothetical protein